MNTKTRLMACLIAVATAGWAVPAGAEEGDDERSETTPAPGVAVLTGAGPYYSVSCGCIDRGVWNTQWVARLHFDERGAMEAGIHHGTMLLGGRFPSRGWSLGGQVSLLSQSDDRWWDGVSAKGGYRRWQVSGMRASGAHGAYGGLNWSVEVLPHVHVEADATAYRAFRVMSHWSLTGSVGLSLRL